MTVVALCCFMVAYTIANVVLYTVNMDYSRPGTGGTDFTVLSSFGLICSFVAASLGLAAGRPGRLSRRRDRRDRAGRARRRRSACAHQRRFPHTPGTVPGAAAESAPADDVRAVALTAVAPATVRTAAARLRHRWLILAVLCVAQLVVVLDNTVLTVAVPVLTTELGASTADVQWMINAYALVLSGLLLSAGGAADRYGRRRMLFAGLVLFGLGSLVAGLASTSGHLIAARAGMGIGGALLVTSTLAVAMQVFDGAERSRAIGIWAATSALGFAVGPPIGGTILAHLPWGASTSSTYPSCWSAWSPAVP